MKKIGNTYNLVGKHWRSYVMLSVNGVLLYEKMNDYIDEVLGIL